MTDQPTEQTTANPDLLAALVQHAEWVSIPFGDVPTECPGRVAYVFPDAGAAGSAEVVVLVEAPGEVERYRLVAEDATWHDGEAQYAGSCRGPGGLFHVIRVA